MPIIVADTQRTAGGVIARNQAISSGSTVSGVVVSPATATGSTTFSAVVNGTGGPSQAVNWTTTAGSINSSGGFTAPAQTGSVQTITITATSVQDGSKSGTATVTISAVIVGSNISPTYVPSPTVYISPARLSSYSSPARISSYSSAVRQ